MSNPDNDQFVRFDLGQRIQHILLIFSFTTLSLTGLLQLLVQVSWAQWVMFVLGGIDGVRQIHHLAGMLLIFLFVYHMLSVIWDKIGGRSERMLPQIQDGKDAMQAVTYLLGRSEKKPQYDRFDFRQKMEYWSLIWGTVLMGATGLVMMFPQFVTKYVPGIVVYASKAAHGMEALLAILAIISWHMYSAHMAEGIWPADTTIFTGKISRERMIEEHPLEYQRLMEQAAIEQRAETAEEEYDEEQPISFQERASKGSTGR